VDKTYSWVVKHVVQVGESTMSIAARYGVSQDDLVNANPTKASRIHRNRPVFDVLEEGEQLEIPRNMP